MLRVAEAVVTDDAEEAVDFLLTGRRLLHWSPTAPGTDEAYYPPDAYLPGPVTRTCEDLLTALDTAFDPLDAESQARYDTRGQARLRPHRRPQRLAAGLATPRSRLR